ncbi:hypothetical protein SUGI_0645820 [Cryptomeria japonica]|nr:hypothetical protein SUGI_0645820 [Cryptomeria japonica]
MSWKEALGGPTRDNGIFVPIRSPPFMAGPAKCSVGPTGFQRRAKNGEEDLFAAKYLKLRRSPAFPPYTSSPRMDELHGGVSFVQSKKFRCLLTSLLRSLSRF